MTEKEAALHIVRAVSKFSSAFLNADNMLECCHDEFRGKLRQDVLNFNNWIEGYTHGLMVNLNVAKEDFVHEIYMRMNINNPKPSDNNYFADEMNLFLAKLISGLKNLKSARESKSYQDYLKPIISRVENLISKGHIERLQILNSEDLNELIENFDKLGNELIPNEK